MTKQIERIVNAETGEITERELTQEEIAEQENGIPAFLKPTESNE